MEVFLAAQDNADSCLIKLRNLLSGSTEELVDPVDSSFVLNDPNENVAFLPFGSGMRACVGQKFVIQGVATLIASLLQHYEVWCYDFYFYFPSFHHLTLHSFSAKYCVYITVWWVKQPVFIFDVSSYFYGPSCHNILDV